MRRAALAAAVLVVAVGAVIGLIAIFNGRDDATTSSKGAGPGVEATSPAQLVPILRPGNLVLLAPASQSADIAALARDVAGTPPNSAALRKSGQAILTGTNRPGSPVTALAYNRQIEVATTSDPALRQFLDYWLGRGAQD